MRIFVIASLALLVSSCMPKLTDIIESQVPKVEDIKPEMPSPVEKSLKPFN